MVAEPTALNPLAPLSPTDDALFQRYIESGASLPALAASLQDRPLPSPLHPPSSSPSSSPHSPLPIPDSPSSSPHSPLPIPDSPSSSPSSPPHSPLPIPHSLSSLYLWSAQPHIAAWIDFHETQLHLADQREMRLFLRELVKSSANPIERRRAATTLLRASPGGIPFRTVRHSPRAPRAELTSRATTSATPSTSLNLPNTQSPDHPASSSSQPPDRHQPLATPSADIAESAAANLIASIIKEPRRPRNIATLRAFCMPTAKFAGIPIPTEEQAFHLRAADALQTCFSTSQFRLVRTSSTDSAARFALSTGDITAFSFELRRESGSWLISQLTNGPLNQPP